LLFYFSDRVLPLSETYRHGWRKAKIATQRIHIMLSYFNGFVHRLSFCSQGQHFDIFMENVDMVYMNIMICWNIMMVNEYVVSLFSLSSSRDSRFHLGEGLYLKNKITTAEKRTKLLIY
jgi:hypothetical protein